ncbi:TonB family protein [Rapidithrix thailandica]|uniref:TonB family protein n=1 Tax=Rapidithrix thailandica TaxID=413964 RepID=A0AAW9SGC9_9BACT
MKKLETYQHHLPQEKVYLHFDKPFYKPGDDLWFKAYLRNGSNLQASQTSEIIYVELINPKGTIEKELRLVAQNGWTKGDFHLDESSPGGMYKVKAYTQWMKNFGEDLFFEKDLQVQALVLPKLRMKLDFERKAYGPGDQVVATLDLATLSNQALAKHKFNYTAQLQGGEFNKGKGQTDANGKALVTFDLPEKLETNNGLLNITIDYEGSIESISRSIPIVLNAISLQFFPEGGDLLSEVESNVAFKALNEFGKPADVEGVVLNKDGEEVAVFSSFHQGMGAFTLTPEEGMSYSVQLTKPEGVAKKYTLPEVLPKGYRLSLESQTSGELNVNVHAPLKASLTLILQQGGTVYFKEEISAKEGENSFEIPTANVPAGVAQLTLFDRKQIARCERLVFVSPEKQLQVEISTDKEKYLPREKVEMTIRTKDEAGLPVPANLSLAVVDDKLISFADDKQDNILSYLLLSSEVKGNIEEPGFYFKKDEPKAQEALNYLLMTQGYRRFTWKEVLESTEASLKDRIKLPAEKAVVRGKILDPDTEAPELNAKITVLETEEVTYTDQEGKFEFKNLDLSIPVTLQMETKDGKTRIIQVNDYAQEYVVGQQFEGTVTDVLGTVLPEVSIVVKGTNISTVSDENGRFKLPVSDEDAIFVFSCVGYETKAINPSKVRSQKVVLKEEYKDLEQTFEAAGNIQQLNIRRKNKLFAMPEVAEVVQKQEMVEEIEIDLDVEIEEPELGFDEMLEMDEWVEVDPDIDALFMITEKLAQPEGGIEQFYQYLRNKIKYPEQALKLGREGRVFVQFVVERDGSITNAEVVKGIGAGCDEEALKVISNAPKWEPGQQDGQAVKMKMVLPVVFSTEGENENQGGAYFQVANQSHRKLITQKAQYHRTREFYAPVYQVGEVVETRTDFRQTIYWNPEVRIGKSGETTLTFYNSDEVTTFRATVEGVADEGLVGRQEFTYFTQLPFSMSTKVPPVLAFDDRVEVPVTLKNNTDKAVTGMLSVRTPEGFQLAGDFSPEVSVPAGSVKTITIPYVITHQKAGKGKFTMAFMSLGLRDAFEQTVEILPKGFPATVAFSGNELSQSFEVEINDLVEGSLSATFTAYPDVLTDLMAGIESILREPYGCFEQTSSSTYPNILALQYMEESGQFDPAVRKKALDLIDKGYKRLISFETAEKGYEWFGGVPAHEGLTAYGLMEFKDMEEVYASVDPKMVERTANWVMNRSDGQGGFKLSSQALDEFGRASQEVSNAYLINALTETGYGDVSKALEKANQEALSSKDAYRMALIAGAYFNENQKEKGQALLKELLKQVDKRGFEKLHAEHSITRSGGKSLQVETTSLVLLAMLKSGHPEIKHLQEGVDFLVNSREYGGFGSTQATILALKALTEYAKFSKSTASSGTIVLYRNSKKIASVPYEEGARGEIVIDHLEQYLKPGTQTLEVRFEDTQDALPYTLNVAWSTYTPKDSKLCKVGLDTKLSTEKAKLGETVRLTTVLENKTSEGQPMTLVKVGIPSGLSPQPWQLKELQEQQKVSYYEVTGNYVVFYFRSLKPKAKHTIHLDLKSEIPGDYVAPASSAYLYYTNEFKAWSGGERIRLVR